MDDGGTETRERVAPWRGRPRASAPLDMVLHVRCTAADHALITANAERAGMSVGAYLRQLGTGQPVPRSRRRPTIELAELGRILGALGRIGGNVAQLVRGFNMRGMLPEPPALVAIQADIAAMRAALMEALGRGD